MKRAKLRMVMLAASIVVACVFRIAEVGAQNATYHHVHLTADDPAAAIDWYLKHMGGEKTKVAVLDAVDYDGVLMFFFKGKPGFEGSVGSVTDHIGFSFPDIESKMKELDERGVEIVSGIEEEGPIKYAFVKDPWGTLIEVVEDPDLIGFHHVHLASTDPQESLEWYAKTFGGQITRYIDRIPAIRYGNVWLLAKKVKEQPGPTQGRAIDHLSWGFEDLDAEASRLKADGIKFDLGPVKFGPAKIAFITSPEGVRIELVGPAAE